MEIIYRTEDGEEFYSKKQAKLHEEELQKDTGTFYDALLVVKGYIKMRIKDISPYFVAKQIYDDMDDDKIDFGDVDVDETGVVVFDENGNEHDFSSFDVL